MRFDSNSGVMNANDAYAFRLSVIGTEVPFAGEVRPLTLALAMVH